jgi:hypothetical protein
MSITPLSTPPTRSDPATFNARADAFLTALPVFATEANALAGEMQADADAAALSEAAATAAAAQAALSSSIALWVSGTTYTAGQCVWSPADYQTYRRKTGGAGTTDPSADSANWALLPGDRAWATKTGNYTAVAGDRLHCDTTSGGFAVALPAGPSSGQAVTVDDYASTFANNALTITGTVDGDAGGAILDRPGLYLFIYIDATRGWGMF